MSWLNTLDRLAPEAQAFELNVFCDWSLKGGGDYHGVLEILAVEEFFGIDMAGMPPHLGAGIR